MAIFECDRARQLSYAETNSSLKLAFDRQRVHRQTTMDGNSCAMNLWPFVFDRDINGAGNTGPEAFVTRDAGSMPLRQVVSPGNAFFVHQVERGAQFLCFRFKELTSISDRIDPGTRG